MGKMQDRETEKQCGGDGRLGSGAAAPTYHAFNYQRMMTAVDQKRRGRSLGISVHMGLGILHWQVYRSRGLYGIAQAHISLQLPLLSSHSNLEPVPTQVRNCLHYLQHTCTQVLGQCQCLAKTDPTDSPATRLGGAPSKHRSSPSGGVRRSKPSGRPKGKRFRSSFPPRPLRRCSCPLHCTRTRATSWPLPLVPRKPRLLRKAPFGHWRWNS